MASVIARNFSGPSTLNNAFHNVPHVTTSFGTYVTNPENVVDHYSDYIKSVGVLPGLVMATLILISVGYFIASCCRTECCKATRKCCCPKYGPNQACPPCCGRTILIRDGTCSNPEIIAVTVFSVLAGACLVAGIATLAASAEKTKTVANLADGLSDYQSSIVAETKFLLDLATINNAQLGVLVNSTKNITITPPLRVTLQEALVQSSSAVTDAAAAYDSANVNLDIKSTTTKARSYIDTAAIVICVFFSLYLLLMMGSWLATYACFAPDSRAHSAMENLGAVFTLYVAIVVGILFTALIATGDVCQDPNAYLNKGVGDSSFALYYINCAPGSSNPSSDDLRSAYQASQQVESVVYELYVQTNNTYPNVSKPAFGLVLSERLFQVSINITSNHAECPRPHNMITEIETEACGPLFDVTVTAFLLVPIAILFFTIFTCIMPRKLSAKHEKEKKALATKNKNEKEPLVEVTATENSTVPNKVT